MTKQERKYLRTIYHQYEDSIRKTTFQDGKEIVAEAGKLKIVLKAIFHILCMEGDQDGQETDMINDLFEKHGIKLIEK